MSGVYAFRKEITDHKDKLFLILIISLIGGISGAWLLLKTPEALFQEAIPWLLLFATVLLIFEGQISPAFKKVSSFHQHASSIGGFVLLLILLGVSTYGGFFNAGLSIITLSYLALAGYTNINAMIGLKLLISTTVSLIAIAMFIYNDVIVWYEGTIILCGTLVGGMSQQMCYVSYPKNMSGGWSLWRVLLSRCISFLIFICRLYSRIAIK